MNNVMIDQKWCFLDVERGLYRARVFLLGENPAAQTLAGQETTNLRIRRAGHEKVIFTLNAATHDSRVVLHPLGSCIQASDKLLSVSG